MPELRTDISQPVRNSETVPYALQDIPPVPVAERIPQDADKVVRPAPVRSNQFRPGASAVYEYTAGHRGIFYSQYIKALQQYIDDLTLELGDDLYERMLLDSQIDSCMKVLKVGILADEGKVQSAVQDEQHPRFREAQGVADFCERVIKRLKYPLNLTLHEMLDGVALGHKTAEVIYEVVEYGEDAGKWGVNRIKTKPRNTTTFLVDAYMNQIGILATIPGMPYPIISGQLIADPQHVPNLLPREKFMVFSYNPKDCDPRGRSGLRSAYDGWWTKKQTWGEMLKYLAQFGTPSLWGTTAENAQPIETVDSAGNVIAASRNPEDVMAGIMVALRSGSVAAFPYGSTLQEVPVNISSFNIHVQTIDICDRQIAKTILSQTLATEEGEHMARAAAEVHENVMEIAFKYPRACLCACVKSDLLYQIVCLNYGEEVAAELTPDYVLTDMNREDFAKWSAVVVSMFQSGYLTRKQKLWIDQKLGFPKADEPTEEKDQIDGSEPAIIVVKQAELELQMQGQQAEMQAQQQAQAAQAQSAQGQQGQANGIPAEQGAQGQQGQVPEGFQNPQHPNNQQQQGQPQPQEQGQFSKEDDMPDKSRSTLVFDFTKNFVADFDDLEEDRKRAYALEFPEKHIGVPLESKHKLPGPDPYDLKGNLDEMQQYEQRTGKRWIDASLQNMSDYGIVKDSVPYQERLKMLEEGKVKDEHLNRLMQNMHKNYGSVSPEQFRKHFMPNLDYVLPNDKMSTQRGRTNGLIEPVAHKMLQASKAVPLVHPFDEKTTPHKPGRTYQVEGSPYVLQGYKGGLAHLTGSKGERVHTRPEQLDRLQPVVK